MAAEGDTPARQGPELLAFNAARAAAPDHGKSGDPLDVEDSVKLDETSMKWNHIVVSHVFRRVGLKGVWLKLNKWGISEK